MYIPVPPDFPGSSDGKAYAYDAGYPCSVHGSGRSGEGNGNSFQYSCLENSMDRGTWLAAVRGAGHKLDTTEQLHFVPTDSLQHRMPHSTLNSHLQQHRFQALQRQLQMPLLFSHWQCSWQVPICSSKELENIERTQTELKNKITEMQNTSEGIKSKLGNIEE